MRKTGWNSALTVEANLQMVVGLKVLGLILQNLYVCSVLKITLGSSENSLFFSSY